MDQARQAAPKPKTKIVIRHFPPGFTQDQFFELIQPWLPSLSMHRFVPGRRPRPLTGQPIMSGRAHLDFRDTASLLEAAGRLNGRHLVDAEGYEGVLEASVAVSQGTGLEEPRPNKDPLAGTIDSCPEYIAFLAELEAEEKAAAPAPIPLDKQYEIMMEQERKLNPWKHEKDLQKQTPLLLHLKSKSSLKPVSTTTVHEISFNYKMDGSGGGGGAKKGKNKKKKAKQPEAPKKSAAAPAFQQLGTNRLAAAPKPSVKPAVTTTYRTAAPTSTPAGVSAPPSTQAKPTTTAQPIRIMARPKQAAAPSSGQTPAPKPSAPTQQSKGNATPSSAKPAPEAKPATVRYYSSGTKPKP